VGLAISICTVDLQRRVSLLANWPARDRTAGVH